MSASKLVKPCSEHKETYIEALKEFQAEGRYTFIDVADLEEDFDAFVEKLNEGKKHIHKPYADWVEPVPETVLWLIGHINFVIRPTMRGKGFGKKILQKGMPYVCYLGIEKALITVAPDNESGIKIIEHCGGVFDDETNETDKFPARRRYWLSCN